MAQEWKKKAEVLWENGALKKTISTWDESGNLIGGETLQIRLQEKADKITQLNAEKESAFRNLDNQRKLLEESERKKRLKKAEQYNSIRKAIRNNQVISGMTPHDVIESIGYPNNINRSLYGNQHHEQWVYSIGNYVYFTSGIVTSIQSYN